MNTLCTLPLASIGELIPLAGLIAPFVFVTIVSCFGILQNAHQRKLQHETMRIALEKGQPIPKEMLVAPEEKINDRKSGIILVSIAAGIFVACLGLGYTFEETGLTLGATIVRGLRYIALIPGLIGVGLLINWKLEQAGKDAAKKD